MSNGTVAEDASHRADSTLRRLWERTVVPVLLMTSTPNVVILLWFCAAHCHGSYACLGRIFGDRYGRAGISL